MKNNNYSKKWGYKYLCICLSVGPLVRRSVDQMVTASMVEGLESMTSNPVTSLAWVRSPGDSLVV
jgi:macrodomain Ter protein organizer (MatP/YcbG family)